MHGRDEKQKERERGRFGESFEFAMKKKENHWNNKYFCSKKVKASNQQ